MEWFLIGVFLAVVLAWSRKRDKESETRIAAGKNAKQCPHCAEWVRAEATTCRYCQRAVPPVAPRGVEGDGIAFARRAPQQQYGVMRSESAIAAFGMFAATFIGVIALLAIISALVR